MTHLKCGLIDGHPRVEMKYNMGKFRENTVVNKEPDIIGFKDKSNDISKRTFEQTPINQTSKPTKEFD